jgi:hypothetical protein
MDIYGKFGVYKHSKIGPVLNERITTRHEVFSTYSYMKKQNDVNKRQNAVLNNTTHFSDRGNSPPATAWGGHSHSTVCRPTTEKQHTPQRRHSTTGIGNLSNITWHEIGSNKDIIRIQLTSRQMATRIVTWCYIYIYAINKEVYWYKTW